MPWGGGDGAGLRIVEMVGSARRAVDYSKLPAFDAEVNDGSKSIGEMLHVMDELYKTSVVDLGNGFQLKNERCVATYRPQI